MKLYSSTTAFPGFIAVLVSASTHYAVSWSSNLGAISSYVSHRKYYSLSVTRSTFLGALLVPVAVLRHLDWWPFPANVITLREARWHTVPTESVILHCWGKVQNYWHNVVKYIRILSRRDKLFSAIIVFNYMLACWSVLVVVVQSLYLRLLRKYMGFRMGVGKTV